MPPALAARFDASRPAAAAAGEFEHALPPGELLEYRIESVLGAGGFGITYLALDAHLEKKVAIKEYFPCALAVRALDGGVVPVQTERRTDYQWGMERFVQEARTLARFSHPSIVRVNRYFTANNTAYMVMDFEDGEPLARWIDRRAPVLEEKLRELLAPILDGLEQIHAQGFLHRDIKPANLLVRRSGTPVLLDFGAARQAVSNATRNLTAIVSPGYAPYEQYASDGNQGPWSDIYSLGAVLLRAMTGRNPPDTVARLKKDAVPEIIASLRGEYGEALLQATARALQLDEKARPGSVAEWRTLLAPAPALAPRKSGASLPATPAMTAPAIAALAPATMLAPAAPQTAERTAPAMALPAAAAVPAAAAAPAPGAHALAQARPQTGLTRAAGRAMSVEPHPPARAWARAGLLILAAAALGAGYRYLHRPAAPPPPGAVQALAGRVQAPLAAPAGRPDAPPSDVALRRGLRPQDRAAAESAAPRLAADHGPNSLRPGALSPLQAVRRNQPMLARQFDAADANRDGSLSREEARAGLPAAEKLFAEMDIDGDGRVALPELALFRRRHERRPPPDSDARRANAQRLQAF